MLRDIHDDAAADTLASERGACRAWDDAETIAVGKAEDLLQVRLVLGKCHRSRHFLIFRGIGGVELAQRGSRVQFALHTGRELAEGNHWR